LVGDYSISNGIITINPNLATNGGSVDGISVPDGIYSVLTFSYPIEVRTKVTAHTSYVRYSIGLLGLSYGYDDGGPSWWGLILNQSRVVTWGYDVPANALVGDVLVRITYPSFYLKDPTSNTPQTWSYGLSNNPNNYRIRLSAWATSTISLDFVSVRKYTSPEPTANIGNEEVLPPITFNLFSSGNPSASMGNYFSSIIYLKNGTIIKRDFDIGDCNLGKDCILSPKITLQLSSEVPIEKMEVCSKGCPLVCNEYRVS